MEEEEEEEEEEVEEMVNQGQNEIERVTAVECVCVSVRLSFSIYLDKIR